MEFGEGLLPASVPDSVDGDAVVESVVGLGPGIELFDVDHDGYLETRVSTTDDGVTVAADQDGDGVIDTFTSIGSGGRYETWDIFRASDGYARWERTASGDLSE